MIDRAYDERQVARYSGIGYYGRAALQEKTLDLTVLTLLTLLIPLILLIPLTLLILFKSHPPDLRW